MLIFSAFCLTKVYLLKSGPELPSKILYTQQVIFKYDQKNKLNHNLQTQKNFAELPRETLVASISVDSAKKCVEWRIYISIK